MTTIVLDILTLLALTAGLFFMFIGALGLWRMPDLYHRMHAGSKCITLGISGMLLASVFHLAEPEPTRPVAEGGSGQSEAVVAAAPSTVAPSAVAAATKALLVIIFQFVAAPVAAHMLSRAAHLDAAEQWEGTLSDEFAEDRGPMPK
ncbi:MAG TPA: monovalent cation/H(+) antiporter subunit G [Tepidisphaeraceae bacterium]|nr:monovalent cation/H(+) antiporter subunit G [Tepidisphaeraceae bacterium]